MNGFQRPEDPDSGLYHVRSQQGFPAERVAMDCQFSAHSSVHQNGEGSGRKRGKDREWTRKRKLDAVENIGPNGDGLRELQNRTMCLKPCVKEERTRESVRADVVHYSRKVTEAGESLSVRDALK